MSTVRTPVLPRLSVVEKLRNEFNEELVALPWWLAFFSALDDPQYYELLLVIVRQTGKSTLMGAAAVTELFVPNSYTMLVAASEAQQAAIFDRKIRKPLERILSKELRKKFGARFTRNGVEFSVVGSQLEVIASNQFTAPGRTPTKLFIDEARDVGDSVYTALAPSVVGAGGKVVIASTTGRPSGFFYALVNNPTPQTWLYRSNENDNPRANRGVLGFLKDRIALVSPAAARRELHGEFTDDGDELLPAPLIDAAIDDMLGELMMSRREAFGLLDLSRKRDLSSLVIVVREDPRRPEATDHLVVASIQTWDPKASPTGEVDFAEVRAALGRLPERFPNLMKLLVDEGAEAGTVLPFCRQHPRLSLVTEGFIAAVKSNMEMWGSLAGRLNARTISIPRHERLLAELRGLRKQEFAYGSKYRVVDSSRKLHRDVSLALAGACMAAGAVEACDYCGEPGCSGYHLLGTGLYPARTIATNPGPDVHADSLPCEHEPVEEPDAPDPAPDSPLAGLRRAAREKDGVLARLRRRREEASAARAQTNLLTDFTGAVVGTKNEQEAAVAAANAVADAIERREQDAAAAWLKRRIMNGPAQSWFPTDL